MRKQTELIGKRFGRLTVIAEASRRGGKRYVSCQCDCGTTKEVYAYSLTKGATSSCGCLNREVAKASAKKKSPIEIFPGKKFHQLTVISSPGTSENGHRLWLCKCDCGNETTVFATNLRKPHHTISCGCHKIATAGAQNRTHGLGSTREYSVWRGMLARCLDEGNAAYVWYGGRGITICQAWLEDFTKFHAWAVKNGSAAGLQIDRIDNDGPYSPENCRFVTPTVNANNKQLISAKNNSGYRGAAPYGSNGKFRARVTSSLGPWLEKAGFPTLKEAAIARDIHCIKHGISVPLNFPELALQGPL